METVLLIIGLIVLAAVIFVFWLCARIALLILRAITGLVRPKPAPGQLPAGVVACGHPGCRAANASHARFCRRCGVAIGALARPGSAPAPRPLPHLRYVA